MTNCDAFNCYLIGEDSLLIEFAHVLAEHGHTLLGFISTNQQVREWAENQKISCLDTLEVLYNTLLNTTKVDYIFSFVNNKLISASILNQVRYFAINYHNSPLPRYAGSHATSWAILNNEKQHGITWHVMTETIDAGDILKQVTFPIGSNETTLSLDLKCLEKALETFRELVMQLGEKNYSRIRQSETQRTYYSLHQKPSGNGLIDWSASAEEIKRLYRGLNFSNYTNTLALPKFLIENNVYIIRKLKILNVKSTFPPGTIVKISKKSIIIATQTHDLLIHKVSTITGQECLINDLIQLFNLSPGYRFKSKNYKFRQHLQNVSSNLSCHEMYWVTQLTHILPLHLPINAEQSKQNSNFVQIGSIPVASYLQKLTHINEKQFILLMVILIYIYRINGNHPATIAFHNHSLKQDIKHLEMFFSTHVPFTLSLQPEMSFFEAFQRLLEYLEHLEGTKTYSHDIAMRYPILHNHLPQLSVAIAIVEKLSDYELSPNYPITFIIYDNGHRFSLFTSHTSHDEQISAFITNISGHIETLIKAASENNQLKIKEIPLLTTNELQKIIKNSYCPDKLKFDYFRTIPEVFEEQVHKAPDNVAVIDEDYQLTYKTLNHRANQLAHYLINQGVRTEEIVAICTDRHKEMIIGMLGILKAGGAYLPIDPNYPEMQIRSILEDSKANFILTQKHLVPYLKKCLTSFKKNSISIIIFNKKFEQEISKNPNINLTPTNLAYILYTSGSTGIPKGVQIEHKSIINLINYLKHKAQISNNDRIINFASYTFDASAWEIYSALLSGATLCLASKDSLLPGQSLTNTLNRYKITCATLPPSILHTFATEEIGHLRVLTIAGEACSVASINQLLRQSFILINGYGPTEAAICATMLIYKKEVSKYSIGKPILNTQIFILDAYLQPVPIGVTGELCITGAGLARGYLNKQELTNEKFTINPFSNDPNSRLYKTGDLARWLPDGNIEYRGRLDSQIKIRGFRVELNAIENALLTHSNIEQAVVMLEDDNHQHPSLSAYLKLTTNNENAPSLATIRNYLHTYLPDYMIPTVFFIVDKFPVTAHGKINKNLLVKTHKQQIKDDKYVPPTSLIQQKLAEIWEEFLHVNKIGIYDNFFSLGGHSLLVAEMFTRIYQLFNTHISLQAFLGNPTIDYLAHQLEHKNKEKSFEFSAINFSEDVQLDNKIRPAHYTELFTSPKAILLTGSTGFLGIHLLDQLHRSTSATIYCLIRAANNQEARNKLENALKYYCLSDISLSPRIVILIGDLAKENLGLSELLFQKLSKEINAIYHNGAWVNHVYNYNILKPSNINSTVNLLKLASMGSPKILHYLSTLAASIPSNSKGTLLENFPQRDPSAYILMGGYEQTKWVSECLLAEAHQRGFPVKIYRLGWIGGQSETGICEPKNNHFLLFLKGCIQLGHAPDRDNLLDIVPVDIASQAIVRISLAPQAVNQVFHITNPSLIGWKKIINLINEAGYQVKLVPPTTWHREYLMHIDKNNALYPFLPLYADQAGDWLSLHEMLPRVNSHHTLSLLKTLGVSYPRFSKRIFYNYLSFLQKSNFLERPQIINELT